MAEIRFPCFSCQKELVYQHPPGRRDDCSFCGADVHSCKNCKHFDRNAYNECREPAADVVQIKDRANFCDFFTPGGKAGGADPQKDLKAAAEALFRKK